MTGAAPVLPSTPWTPRVMPRRPVPVLQQFLYSYPFKIQTNVRHFYSWGDAAISLTATYQPAESDVYGCTRKKKRSIETNAPQTVITVTQQLTRNVAIMPDATMSLPTVRLFSVEMQHNRHSLWGCYTHTSLTISLHCFHDLLTQWLAVLSSLVAMRVAGTKVSRPSALLARMSNPTTAMQLCFLLTR